MPDGSLASNPRRIAPAPAWSDLFDSARQRLPGSGSASVARLREASFRRFYAQGFPSQKVESWKYTSARRLADLDVALAPPAQVTRADIAPWIIGEDLPRAVFVNGHLVADLCWLDDLPASVTMRSLAALLDDDASWLEEAEDTHGLSLLNAAFATDGAIIDVPAGVEVDQPLQLLFISVGGSEVSMAAPRNHVRLGKGARLELVESHITLDGSAGFTNLASRIELGQGARLLHDRVQIGGEASSFVGSALVQLAAGSHFDQTLATVGGALTRNETAVRLDGSGIEMHLNGIYLPRGAEHVDNTIRIDHLAPGSESNQFYKGVLDDAARAVFAGKIVVHKPAQKTNAFQSNNNLMLSSDAEVDSKPELEIYADDVKCSHGATVGELDEVELFYLRSRGLDPHMARSMLTYAYAGEVVARFTQDAVKSQVRRALLERLPGGDALMELV